MLIFGVLWSLCVVLFAEVTDEQLLSILRDVNLQFDSSTEWSSNAFNFTSIKERVKRYETLNEGDCTCGPETVTCMTYSRGKLCRCENQLYVIDGECKDCGDYCSNALCDFRTGTCICIKDHARNADECVPCNCGEDVSCDFALGIKFCNCKNYLSVNSKCDECVCRDNEFCLLKQVETQCDCTPSAEDVDPRCKDCDCLNEDQNCTYVDAGKACHCIPPYVPNEEGDCVECICEGADFECSIKDGEKNCRCEDGYLEHNGTCKECYCGDGHSCNLDGGNKTCICKEDHLEYNGTCRQCDCSANKVCEIKDDQVVCVCKGNFKEDYNGICRECFCGTGHDCELFPGGEKICICKDKYHENNGICEECDCGTGHTCEFKDGKKSCRCAENFSDNNGKCEECSCGDFPCFYENGVKACICNGSYIQHEGTCHEVCHSSSCMYGVCQGIGIKSYCRCNFGFSGPNCEKQVDSAGMIVISLVTVALILLSIVLVVLYLRRLKRATGYSKEDLTQQTEELYNDVDNSLYRKEETVM